MTSRSKSGALQVLQTSTSGSKLVGVQRKSARNAKPIVNDAQQDVENLTARNNLKSIGSQSAHKLTHFFAKTQLTTVKEKTNQEIGIGTDAAATHEVETETDVSFPIDDQRTDTAESTKEMLLAQNPNQRYLKMLAEERRKALTEALQENLQMAQEIAILREENNRLKHYQHIVLEAMQEEADE